jgi:hypothetical protein
MESGSKQPTVEDYFSDDSAHGNEGIEDHSASSPDSRRAPLPTSQPCDPESDSGYASYTDATYRKSQNIEYNEIYSTEDCSREEKGNSQRRPREDIAKPAQLPKQRLPTIVHSDSVPKVIVENRPRETAYHTERPREIARRRRSIPTALSSPDITQGARDMPIIQPSIRPGSYWGRPGIEINIQSARNSRSVRQKGYRIEPREFKQRPKVDAEGENEVRLKTIDRYMEEIRGPRLPANEASMAEFIISKRGTEKSYIKENSRRWKYMHEHSSRDGQQTGTQTQSQKTITRYDGEIDDDTSKAKTIAQEKGAHCEGSVVDLELGIQDHADGVTEKHILRNNNEPLEAGWKDVWNMIPEVWKWDLEYHTIHRADGTRRGCWTCTPLESDEPTLYPLTIAAAPVVLPVEHQWPPAAGLNPPPDPRPSTPIDCSGELPLDTIRDLFLTFDGSVGFYILISGLIQVIVPDDFDLVRETQFSSPLVL